MLRLIGFCLGVWIAIGGIALAADEPSFSAEHLQQVLNQVSQASLQTQTLHQLGSWYEQGQISHIQAWLKQHPTEANTLANELYIDVHASPWLGIPPQYPHSPELLPILAKELNMPKLSEPPCTNQQMEKYAPECEETVWEEELLRLFYHYKRREYNRIERLSLDSNLLTMRETLAFYPKTQRGFVQNAYDDGLDGNIYPRRLKVLIDGLHKAKTLSATAMEVLQLLAISETLAEWDGKSQSKPLLTATDKNQLIQLCLKQGHALSQTLKSPRLEAEVMLQQAFVTEGNSIEAFKLAEQAIRSLPPSPIQESLCLTLIDDLMLHGRPVNRRYRQLFFEGRFQRLLVLERMLKIKSPAILVELQKHYPKESDLTIKEALISAFVADKKILPLISMFKNETRPYLRQAMIKSLLETFYTYDIYNERLLRNKDIPSPEDFYNFLFSLAEGNDKVIRTAIAQTMKLSTNKSVQGHVLSWGQSPYPELQAAALEVALTLNDRKYLWLAIQLIYENPSYGFFQALNAIEAWGQPAYVPLFKALLPLEEPVMDNALRKSIARIEGHPIASPDLLLNKLLPHKYHIPPKHIRRMRLEDAIKKLPDDHLKKQLQAWLKQFQ